jgi:hypothetical protein
VKIQFYEVSGIVCSDFYVANNNSYLRCFLLPQSKCVTKMLRDELNFPHKLIRDIRDGDIEYGIWSFHASALQCMCCKK